MLTQKERGAKHKHAQEVYDLTATLGIESARLDPSSAPLRGPRNCPPELQTGMKNCPAPSNSGATSGARLKNKGCAHTVLLHVRSTFKTGLRS